MRIPLIILKKDKVYLLRAKAIEAVSRTCGCKLLTVAESVVGVLWDNVETHGCASLRSRKDNTDSPKVIETVKGIVENAVTK